MKLSTLIKNIPHSGEGECDITNIVYDSRRAHEGCLFVCLTGALRDGHEFAPKAYEGGARAFLVERELSLPGDCIQIITPDSRAALAVIAADFYGRPADKLHIIGITGTKGKTTTALLVQEILSEAGLDCAYIGSNGVIINGYQRETANTTPESLVLHSYFDEMVRLGVKYAVLEVSSQALIHNRVDGVPFEVCAFTNLSPDHISPVEHPTFEDYRDAKRRLFTDFDSKYAVYNADDPASAYMLCGYRGQAVSVSLEGDADFSASKPENYRSNTSLGISYVTSHKGGQVETRLMSPGAFSVYNGLCATAICACLGVSPEISAEVLAKTPVQGRFEIVEGTPGVTFVVDYSHNGLSLTKALCTLRDYEPKRLICVFGSVGGRTQCRRRELAEAASKYADYSIITSDNPDFEDPDAIIAEIASHMGDAPYECITDRRDAIKRAVNMAREGDIVLFAGKGHESYQLICGKKELFSEREIIEETCGVLSAL